MCYSHKKFKVSIKSRIKFEKVDRVIKFNQNAELKPYVDMNNKLKQKGKKNEKDIFRLINNVVFGKTMEDVRKQRNIKLVTTERSENI